MTGISEQPLENSVALNYPTLKGVPKMSRCLGYTFQRTLDGVDLELIMPLSTGRTSHFIHSLIQVLSETSDCMNAGAQVTWILFEIFKSIMQNKLNEGSVRVFATPLVCPSSCICTWSSWNNSTLHEINKYIVYFAINACKAMSSQVAKNSHTHLNRFKETPTNLFEFYDKESGLQLFHDCVLLYMFFIFFYISLKNSNPKTLEFI